MVKIELFKHGGTAGRRIAEEPDWPAARKRLEQIIGGPLPREQAIPTSTDQVSWERNEKRSKYSIGDQIYLLTGPVPPPEETV